MSLPTLITLQASETQWILRRFLTVNFYQISFKHAHLPVIVEKSVIYPETAKCSRVGLLIVKVLPQAKGSRKPPMYISKRENKGPVKTVHQTKMTEA